MEEKGELFEVTVGTACFGIVVRDGKVKDSAPIGRWMIGKSFDFIKKWVGQRSGTVIRV